MKKAPNKPRIPSLRLHKGSGQAVVTIPGQRDIYCGKYGTPEAQQTYERVIAEWLANGKRLPLDPELITVVELVDAYVQDRRNYYGAESESFCGVRQAVKPLLALYGRTRAAEFGPRNLRTIQGSLIDAGLTRSGVNRKVAVIRRVFKWGVGNGLIPATVFHALQCVENLKRGRTAAPETDPVRAVEWEVVQQTIAYLPPPVAGIVLLMWHTGARVGEILPLRRGDIDTTGEIWEYHPRQHKTAWKGNDRVIFFGKEAQRILRLRMMRKAHDEILFAPIDAHKARSERSETHRRPNQSPTPRKTNRVITEMYDASAIHAAIRRAVKLCNEERAKNNLESIPDWHSHQLRHAFATRARQRFGIEAARVTLGHKDPGITLTYAERDLENARTVIAEIG